MPEPPGDPMPWTHYRRTDPRRHYAHVVQTIGRRGLIFALLGVLALVQGLAELIEGRTVFGIGWLAAGVVAIVWSGRPQGRDKPAAVALYIAYGSLVVESIIRFALWLVSDWITDWLLPYGLADLLPHSSPVYLLSIIGYGALLTVIIAVAGWRENLPDKGGDHAKHR